MTANRSSNEKWRHLTIGVCAAFFAIGVMASDDHDHDHDRARHALEAGEVLPLRTILEQVERDYPGQVLDVELERDHEHGGERWVYKIKLLRTGGALVRLKIDARNGKVVGKKTREENRN